MFRKTLSILAVAAFIGSTAVNAVAVYGQCGGQGYTGSTVCDAGSTCVYSNPCAYFLVTVNPTATELCTVNQTSPSAYRAIRLLRRAQRLPLLLPPAQPQPQRGRLRPRPRTASVSYTATPPADNPYIGYTVYLNPQYVAEVLAAVATINIGDPTLAKKAAQVEQIPTFIWLDAASKVPTLGSYLADALAKQQSSGLKYLVQIVIYDLPDRDCELLASSGEYSIANNGVAYYKAYINAIATQISAYPDVRVIAIYEPDSLVNLVTNLNVQKCASAQTAYESLAIYAWQNLNQPNVYIYVDGGNAGSLGWPATLAPAAQLFGTLYKQAGPTRIRGLATNVAGYNALNASSPDPVTSGNPNYDELHYINALAPLLTSNGFPAHFIVDQSRSGVQNIRIAWGDWCNINNAGFGIRPTTNTNSSLIDAIVWVKPGGESDGAPCSGSDSKPNAPAAGTWFEAYFEMLVTNAYPPFIV